MAKVPLVSMARHNYNGRAVMVNEFFWANNERDADDLRALRFVRLAKEDEIPTHSAPTYDTKNMEAGEEDYEHVEMTAPAVGSGEYNPWPDPAEEASPATRTQNNSNRHQRRHQHNRRDFNAKK
jgi:hypothetical protein